MPHAHTITMLELGATQKQVLCNSSTVISRLIHSLVIKIDCGDGDIRLVDGSSPLEGRVEVCFSGVWGTVCSHFWGRADAAVACRQLGYSSSG